MAALLVYVLPIVTPHVTMPFGAALATGWMEGRPPLWMAAEIALAILAQDVAFGLGWWYFRMRDGTSRFLYFAAFPVLWWVVNWAYLTAIPQYFLVDSASQPEIGEWEEECFLPGYFLPDVPTPPDLSMERAGRAVVAESATQEVALLEAPGCQLTAVGLRWSNADPTIHGVTAEGAVLFRTADESWHVLPTPGGEAIDVSAAEGAEHPSPILSTDGEWVAWLVRPPAVVLTPTAGDDARSVDLQPFAPGSFRLDFLDMGSGTLIVARNETEFLTLGFDGVEKVRPWNPDWVKAWVGSVRRLGDGWLAWDAYQDEAPYRLAWALPGGVGEHTAQSGYRISSAALDASGRYIGVSVSGRYNFDMPDGVYVLRADDREEVFRRRFPRFTRSRAAFLGSELFAYSEPAGVRVLRLPQTAEAVVY